MTLPAARSYGLPPYRVAVLHGGPGAPGSAAALARELGRRRGVLEPLQSATSIDGQVAELRDVLLSRAEPPVALVGWSWGAILAYLTAARHPDLVVRLVLVGSAAFDARSAALIEPARLARLDARDRARLAALRGTLAEPGRHDAPVSLAEMGALLDRADSVDPLPLPDETLEVQPEVYARVWDEAERLRASGGLLDLGRRIRCPVLAVHGADDPHPVAGVREPLAGVLDDFRFVLLPRCGHTPWAERQAREAFLRVVEGALDESRG